MHLEAADNDLEVFFRLDQRLDELLARAVADGDGAGAIRALDEIIAILEGLVNGLDVLS